MENVSSRMLHRRLGLTWRDWGGIVVDDNTYISLFLTRPISIVIALFYTLRISMTAVLRVSVHCRFVVGFASRQEDSCAESPLLDGEVGVGRKVEVAGVGNSFEEERWAEHKILVVFVSSSITFINSGW